ncbi:phytoene desaturase family protein [Aquimarina rhabdastrellae]
MGNHYDVLIIGSGLGGLVSANILAKEGKRVCVLEKNNQFGGNLQTFVRDKSIFDTGVHYIGGLDKGQNLHRYFQYLGIMDDLKLSRMDMDAYDVITFDGDEIEYPHAQGYDNFVKQLVQYFPEEEEGIQRYVNKVRDTCYRFPLYNLEFGNSYDGTDLLTLKAKEFIDSVTKNEKLRAVLAGSNLLYAGDPEKTPFYVHALSINSYIESSWRCINGGSQIAKLLIKRLRELGGTVLKYQEVNQFEIEEKNVKAVSTVKGDRFTADCFISNVDPKLTLSMIGKEHFRNLYYNRIQKTESVISAFSIYLVFKEKTFKYLNKNYYHSKSIDRVWLSDQYTEESWPEAYLISMAEDTKNPGYADNLTSIAYMHYEDVAQWEDTFNTVVNETERGADYERFKQERVEAYLIELEKKFPEIRKHIKSIHTSTPLSYRDYIGCYKGGMYGFKKDADNPMRSFLSPRTKISNLFFTGQGLNMHGILGVTISAVLTCSEIVGKEHLLKKILASEKEREQITKA